MVTVDLPDGAAFDCDDAGCPDGAAPGACGDGVTAGVETCDDGNLVGGDGCSPSCQIEACGNGTVDVGEECDPPGVGDCSSMCRRAQSLCGNGIVEADEGEQCDDGNMAKGDGCRNCRTECGDGLLDRDIGEECEPEYTPKENGVSTTCTTDCRLKPFCGDGKVNNPGEECEPVDGLTCAGECKRVTGLPDAGSCVPLADADAGAPGVTENSVPNPGFTADLAGWTASAAVTATHVADQGATAPGAARVTFRAAAGPALTVDGIQRCVTVPAGVLYDLEAQYLNPPGQPAGTKAYPVILLYANTTCSGRATIGGAGALAPVTDTGQWLPYKLTVDAGRAGPPGTTASISIKLGVVVPAGQSGTVLWDDVSLRPAAIDPNCGNCRLDPGETCDDGNRVRGDGCGPRCRLERDCGNGILDPGEECDDGEVTFTGSGMCTPMCTRKTTCDQCAIGMCRAPVDACLELDGLAQAGRGKGQSRAVLCGRLRACIHRSGCNGSTAISGRPTLSGQPGVFMENCYCGTAGAACLMPGLADGSCRAEIEAALETDQPTVLLQRVGGADSAYPVFAALADLLLCEKNSCASQCVAAPLCGNGVMQERTAEFARTFQLEVGGKKEMCLDALTPSKKGCAFEECDGQLMCDENCFNLRCGNGLKQTGEDCDDGNTTAGDGCDDNCKAEYECGDSMVATQFGEQCDPPNTGPLCSMAEFAANPTSCGCGPTCDYKVCGNSILQEGEECDPPNGATCGPDCKFAGLGECIDCLLLNTKGACEAPLFLNGDPDVPGFEMGCLDDSRCFKLLQCQTNTKCATDVTPAACFCGLTSQDIDQCESPDFQAKGPCKVEIEAAFSAQFGVASPSNKTVVDRLFDPVPPGLPPALFFANSLIDCISFDFAGELRTSGVPEATIQKCVVACRGPQ
jgi:cysteine-rich repeat protein